MSPDHFFRFLLGSLILNYAILLMWFLVFVFARGFLRRLHGRWFQLPDSTFDAIHYGGMAIYKISILLFNLVPLLVLCLIGPGG